MNNCKIMSRLAAGDYVLITGASSGIGAGFAREFSKRGCPLILTARREERLLALQKELSANGGNVQIIAADLDANDGAQKIFDECRRHGWRVGGLVNNAGLGIHRSFINLSMEQVEAMLRVNVSSLVALSRLFLPPMAEAKKGFVLNISSVAGFQPVPYFSVYAATKSMVLTLSEGLYEELKPHGVLVSCLCPGPVDTEFHEVAGRTKPHLFARNQSVDEVVARGMSALACGRPVAWSSGFQRVSSVASEILPRFVRRKISCWLMLKSGAS